MDEYDLKVRFKHGCSSQLDSHMPGIWMRMRSVSDPLYNLNRDISYSSVLVDGPNLSRCEQVLRSRTLYLP